MLPTDNLPCHFTAAFGAGFCTTIVASPVDVVKTRFMNSTPGQYTSAINCAMTMLTKEGPSSFYKGCVYAVYWPLLSLGVTCCQLTVLKVLCSIYIILRCYVYLRFLFFPIGLCPLSYDWDPGILSCSCPMSKSNEPWWEHSSLGSLRFDVCSDRSLRCMLNKFAVVIADQRKSRRRPSGENRKAGGWQ